MSKRHLNIFEHKARSIPALVQALQAGDVVAAPTETAYGLFADATNLRAVQALLKLKGKRGAKPVPLVAADARMVARYCHMNKLERRLAKRFWPGPLTLVLKARRKLPRGIAAANGTIGIRVPGSAWLRGLLRAVGRPLTATSANRSNGPTPYSAAQVGLALGRRGLNYLVDKGKLRRRPTSTIAVVRRSGVAVLRRGAISERRLQAAVK